MVLSLIQNLLPKEFISRLAYVLVDEFQQVKMGSSVLMQFHTLINETNVERNSRDRVKVVFASQDLWGVDCSNSFPISIITDLNKAKDLLRISLDEWNQYSGRLMMSEFMLYK
jgi:hypothetical protein